MRTHNNCFDAVHLVVWLMVLSVVARSVYCASVDGENMFFVDSSEDDEEQTNNSYHDWYETRGANYEHSVFLNVNRNNENHTDGLALHWTMQADTIELAVAVRATEWVGFGLAEAGGMPGSDIFVCNSTHVVDMYATSYDTPLMDEQQNGQDWNFVQSTQSGGFLICEVSRSLDTGNRQEDRALFRDDTGVDQPHRVIAAWGDGAWGYHGPHNRASGAVRFFNHRGHGGLEGELFQAAMEEETVHVIDIVNSNYALPREATKYAKFCFTLSHDFPYVDPEQAFHAIGIEPIIGSARHVHHMVMSASPTDYGEDCKSLMRNDDNEDSLYGWAVGEGPVALPKQAGLPIAAGGGYRSFRLSIHYDNRFLDRNVVDSGSGFRMYLSPNLRPNVMGMFGLAEGKLNDGVAVGGDEGGAYRYHDFVCPSSCTNSFFPDGDSDDEIVVVREMLHMHETGARMYNRIRNATGHLVHEGLIDYWDVDQSGLFPTSQGSYTIRAGDSFESRCYFDASKSTGDSNEIVWGSGSQDEMCIVFMWYYPKRDDVRACGYSGRDSPCAATYMTEKFNDSRELGRVFGAGGAPETPQESSKADSQAADSSGSRSSIGCALLLAWWYCLLLI